MQAESTVISNTATVSAHFTERRRSHTDSSQLEKYNKLDQKGSVIAEYVWIDASNGLRSKCKVSPAKER